ncbi:glycosyltransferase family 4 protein [Desulfobacula sp.]|uniref:glycosyltransferase family 4 protein n=1 Tax=Desulfobacula sp. TaxID=2593537 RepID=UPI002631F72A|nr:glycosyltransferase family 4 protein [Desulfobacula sp.]
MGKGIILIAPESPPFGGMATQACLLKEGLTRENIQVFFVPTNKSPKLFSEKLWLLPVFRTVGKVFIYVAGILRSLKYCSSIHILACSHLYFYLNVIPAIVIGRIYKKRVVVNYRGGEAESFFKGFAGHFLNVFKLSDSFIVPSGYLKSIFGEFGIQVKVIPNIAQIDKFHFSPPHYKHHIKFICTRNFEAYYDILTLIKSFQLVRNDLPTVSLTLIGDGSLKQDIQDCVKRSGLTGCVKFLGKVDSQDMPYYLSCHDIYVNSSVVDNYPISILEAFSSGLPVISTSAGGIPYLIENDITGILVAPKDYKALARKMIDLANDPELGRNLAENARRIADDHSWSKIWSALKKIYG